MSLKNLALLVLASALLLAGCGDSKPPAPVARKLAFTMQPRQTTSGVALAPAVTVAVQDANGQRVTDARFTVTLALEANPTGDTLGGSLSTETTQGVATFSGLLLNKAGQGYTLVARAEGLESATSQPFTVVSGAPSALAFEQAPGEAQAGGNFGPGVRVAVRDAAGNPVREAVPVTLALGATPAGGTLAGTTTASTTDGVALFPELAITQAAEGYTLVATAPGLEPVTSGAFPVRPGAAAALAFTTQPSNIVAGAAFTPALVVAVRDAFGNTVTSSTATVQLALGNNPAGAALTGTARVNASGGVATFPGVSVDRPGTGFTLFATSPGLTTTNSRAFNVTPSVPSRLAFGVQPTSTVAGSAITPAVTVRVVDAAGNTVATATTSITVALGNNPSSGTLSGTRTRAAVNGVATFTGLSINRTGTGYTLAATAASLGAGTSAAFDVTPGAANRLAFVTNPPASVSPNAAITPAVSVAVRDAAGNTVTTSTAAVTLSLSTNPSGATLGGTLTVNAVNGVATFPGLTLNRTGTGYRLGAASSGLTGTTSTTFNVTSGPASRLAFTVQPANAAAGVAIAPAVRVTVQDAAGNTVTSPAVTVALALGSNPGNATLGGTRSVTTSNGVATFSTLTLNRLGTGYTLVASSGALTAATSSAFNVSAGPASQLVFTVQPADTTAGTPFTPAVQVALRDAFGNPATASTAIITLGLGNARGAVLAGTTVVSTAEGVATFPGVSLARAGTGYTLTASASGLTAATSTAFSIAPGAPSRLGFTVQPSRAFVGQAVSPEVRVAVQDAHGNTRADAMADITVALGNNLSGATLAGTRTAPTVNGVASFADLTLSALGTGYTLTASAADLTGATSAAFDVLVKATRLVYTEPAPGGRIALVRNPASTDTTVVLDLVALEEVTGYSVGMNLPLDAGLVQAGGSLLLPGAALPAGENPTAAYGRLPTSGPLAGVLTTGLSQKAAGDGAVTTDTPVPAGAVLYTVQLALRADAVTGVVFDGAALGPKFRALLRDKLGTDVVSGDGFAIGRLEAQ